MKIQLTGNRIKINHTIRFLVKDKISLPLDKILKDFKPNTQIAAVHIELIPKTNTFKVNFDMILPHKKNLFASTTHLQLESALIDLQQQIEKQIKRYKESLTPYSLG
ncbi:HPF/RaiA family ribosome-associated protein [Patescibacteria group bacterium]|nr:HPF/RaiA family ribosome-associated protein [Patescibacteria group bacterium]